MKHLLFAVFAATTTLLADGLPTVPYLYVEGSAETEVKPDLVSLAFTLSVTSKETSEANKAVQEQAIKVFELLKKSGIADDDVVAGSVSSDPVYEDFVPGSGRPKLLGYRVDRPFTVKVRALEKFPKLVNDLFDAKVARFQGVTEEYSKAKQVEAEMWGAALKNARAKADKLAVASGMKVSSVWAVSQEPIPSIQGRILGPSSPSIGVAHTRANLASGEESAPIYRLAPVEFSQSVHVIYLITPEK